MQGVYAAFLSYRCHSLYGALHMAYIQGLLNRMKGKKVPIFLKD